MKDPVEVRLPGPNRVLVTLRVDDSGKPISSGLLPDLLFNLLHGSTIQSIVSVLSRLRIAESTNVFNRAIASRTDWLRSSSSLPPVPRFRASHISAQASPSST